MSDIIIRTKCGELLSRKIHRYLQRFILQRMNDVEWSIQHNIHLVESLHPSGCIGRLQALAYNADATAHT